MKGVFINILEAGDDRVDTAIRGDSNLGFAVVGVLVVDKLVEISGEDDFSWQHLWGFVGGVANHNALVASAAGVYALGDFGGLFDDFSVNLDIVAGNAANDFFNIDIIGGGGDFAGNKNDTVATTSFGSDAGVWVFF